MSKCTYFLNCYIPLEALRVTAVKSKAAETAEGNLTGVWVVQLFVRPQEVATRVQSKPGDLADGGNKNREEMSGKELSNGSRVCC